MGDTKITSKAIREVNDPGINGLLIYKKCRENFVNFLKGNEMDWKINKVQRRTDLFHQSLNLFYHSDMKNRKGEIQSVINEIGAHIFQNRQSVKAEERKNVPVSPSVDHLVKDNNKFFVEGYELEQEIKKLKKSDQKIILKAMVQKTPIEELGATEEEVKEILAQISSTKGIDAFSTDFELNLTSKELHVSSSNTSLASTVEWLNNGFAGISQQTFKEKMIAFEELRLDETKIKKLSSGKRETQGKELYWEYRKKNILHLAQEIDVEEVLLVAPQIWTLFLHNLDAGKIELPLVVPIKDYLKAITYHCLGKPLDNSVVNGLELKLSANDDKLIAWESEIAKEEEILDRIKENDQRFFTALVKKYQGDFSAAVRKVFKLYDQTTKDRPEEIYYRSFSEVIHKVENNVLKKPLTSSFKTYLIGVGLNLYRQEYYKKTEKPLDIDEGVVEGIAEIATVENTHRNEENAHKVQKYLSSIGEPCKSLLDMKYLKGYNYEVISMRMQKKEGALRTQVSRCLERLRKMIFERT